MALTQSPDFMILPLIGVSVKLWASLCGCCGTAATVDWKGLQYQTYAHGAWLRHMRHLQGTTCSADGL